MLEYDILLYNWEMMHVDGTFLYGFKLFSHRMEKKRQSNYNSTVSVLCVLVRFTTHNNVA